MMLAGQTILVTGATGAIGQAICRALVAEGWAAPDKVFASGGSAGGLLMGVIANEAPGLYRGIVADVPFVDVVTTMLDDTIPLTAQEWTQWGDPRQKAAYDYMLSYSPYDNVRAQAYPAMLVTTGLWDSQVQYFEPAKWVARLRAKKTDANPLLLFGLATLLGAAPSGFAGVQLWRAGDGDLVAFALERGEVHLDGQAAGEAMAFGVVQRARL